MTTTIYQVPGVSCGHCMQAIETEVANVAGVDKVEVDIDAKTVQVDGTAADDQVRKSIEAAGYDVAGVI